MRLALSNLLHERLRFGLSVAGIALAIMLILLLGGLFNGMFRQISAYLGHTPAELVVTQEGVENLLGATSALPPETVASAGQLAGDARVVPILSQFIVLDLHGKKQPVYLVGYDPALGGGPWKLRRGREPQTDDEIVFDHVLAERHALRVGDPIDVMDRELTISGLSDGTTSWMTSFVFIRKTAAEALLQRPGAASFLLVSPAAGSDTQALRQRLDELPASRALLKNEMIANDRELYGRLFSAPLRLMAGIAFLVGTLVVGLVIYTATTERQREYGALKAIGAPNRVLYRVVAAQALIASAAGSLAGFALALVAARLITWLRPQFLVAFDTASVVTALAAGIVMALLAALAPARILARLAPADVFRV
jgi:putative ABC transport system permease protein